MSGGTVSPGRRMAGRVVLACLALGLAGWAVVNLDIDGFVEVTTQAGPIPFFAALAVLPAVGFPTTPLFLLAGAAFGPVLGLVGCCASMTANLALTWWLADSYLRRSLESLLLVRFRYSLPSLSRVGAWRFTVLVKLAPGVPTFMKNYLVGVAGVPAVVYFGVLWPLTMVYASAVILLGDSLHDGDHGVTVGAVGALVVLLVTVKLLRQRWRRGGGQTRDEAEELLAGVELGEE